MTTNNNQLVQNCHVDKYELRFCLENLTLFEKIYNIQLLRSNMEHTSLTLFQKCRDFMYIASKYVGTLEVPHASASVFEYGIRAFRCWVAVISEINLKLGVTPLDVTDELNLTAIISIDQLRSIYYSIKVDLRTLEASALEVNKRIGNFLRKQNDSFWSSLKRFIEQIENLSTISDFTHAKNRKLTNNNDLVDRAVVEGNNDLAQDLY